MSFKLTTKFFITNIINNCPIISSSRLDKTIKAIINNIKIDNLEEVVDYLNKLRIIYYLKRLNYKDSSKAKYYKGKYF